jgi:EF-P beta-lysylation protein EpmB
MIVYVAMMPSPAISAAPPGAAASTRAEPWKRALADAVRDPDELVDLLGLPETLRAGARRAARLFPLVAPRSFIARMRPGDPADPLLRQVLPLDAEEIEAEGFVDDPVGDLAASSAPGLIHKYEGRVLLIAAGTCAVNCRYCFRRGFPYGDAPRGLAAWEPAMRRIEEDPTVREAILSGGDPLVLGDRSLAALAKRLASIPHLETLRVHTRLPVVIPDRVTDGLVAALAGTRLAPIVIIHTNHPAELEGDCAAALRRLAASGIPLRNQAVLLRGVNEDADTLVRLSLRLVDLGVTPYYLHQLDRVRGAAHFEVPEARGLELVEAMRRRLPAEAVPKYVKEIPGAPGKVPVGA